MQRQQNPHKEIGEEDVWTAAEFTDFISMRFPQSTSTKYFIELSLASDYFMFLSLFSLDALSKTRGFQYHVHKREADDQLHILSIYIKKKQTQGKMNVLIIQMDRVIKVTFQSYIAHEQKFKTTNQFSFDHTTYINKKIANTFRLISLKELTMKKEEQMNSQQQSQLNYLFLSRAMQSLSISVKSTEERGVEGEGMVNQMDYMRFFNTKRNWLVGKEFVEVLSNTDSLMRIASFLNIRQISKLSRTNKLLKAYFFTPSNIFYKTLYEFTYGRTGFHVSQMDWVKSLAKKRLQKAKQKHSKFRQTLIFRTH